MNARLADLLAGDVIDAARGLLGWRIRTERSPGPTAVVLTEVEAYSGAVDPASHAYRGETPRNRPMFGPAGTIYVYRSYGLHWCMNIVVGEPGRADAVLLRGGTPIEGIDVMESRRGRRDHLTDGPGKLTAALGVDGADTGTSIGVSITLEHPAEPLDGTVLATPRIGISKAVDLPWRFVLRARPTP